MSLEGMSAQYSQWNDGNGGSDLLSEHEGTVVLMEALSGCVFTPNGIMDVNQFNVGYWILFFDWTTV